ncbi:MAG: hypothetical protein J6Q94_03785 [Clostridia bacterium]|nr:hypothetical protein [Clostridia bacterium]
MFENLIAIPANLNELSDECFARHMLYAQVDAVKNGGDAYLAAFASSYNAELPRLLRAGRVKICVFDPATEGVPEGAFYMQGNKTVDMILGYKPAEGEVLGDMEDMIGNLSEDLVDLPVIKPENEKVSLIREEETVLLDAEKYDTAAAVLCGTKANTEFFKGAWAGLVADGVLDKEAAKILADAKAVFGKNINDIFRLGSDNIELTAFKMCEDGSGDVVLRINETQGRNGVHSFIMSDVFDMGFWFDIDAYETMTFRVNADGMVRQTNFAEGIIPFNHFEW